MLAPIVDILTKTYETWKGRTEEDAVLLAVGELINHLCPVVVSDQQH